jgi:hypothetical protein
MPGRVGAGVVWSWEGTLASPIAGACVALVGKASPIAGASLLTPTSPEKSPAQVPDLGVESSKQHSIVQASKKSHPYSKRPHR